MSVLVTGAAGFIGFHASQALLARGERVIGVDSMNSYYPVKLKEGRLEELSRHRGFTFQRLELSEPGALAGLVAREGDVDRILHLAAQAGVRHSLENPRAYVQANLVGHLEVLEAARHLDASGTSSTPAPPRSMAGTPSCRSRRRIRCCGRCRSTPPPSVPTS